MNFKWIFFDLILYPSGYKILKLWLSDYDMPCHLRKAGYRIEFKFARVIVHMLADKAYLSSGTSTFVKKVGIDLNTIVMHFTVFSEDCKIHKI